MTPRALVTGATGFLGRHLLQALQTQGVPAALLVRQAGAWGKEPWHTELGPVGLIEGHPLASEAWRRDAALGGVRTVFHAAGMVRLSASQGGGWPIVRRKMETMH